MSAKIESPLAKYTSSGQLLCVVCKAPVKNAKLWTAHVKGKAHLQNVLALKEAIKQPAKRPHSNGDMCSTAMKVSKVSHHDPPKTSSLPTDFFDASSPSTSTAVLAPKSILKHRTHAPVPPKNAISVKMEQNSHPAGVSVGKSEFLETGLKKPGIVDRSEALGSQNVEKSVKFSAKNGTLVKTEISDADKSSTSMEIEEKPSENAEVETGSEQTGLQANTENPETVLPEGFFDDPILDAKARNVELKDPLEEEYARFKRELMLEATASEQVIEEDEEEAQLERELDQIDAQIQGLAKVNELQETVEHLVPLSDASAVASTGEPMEESDSSDDVLLDDFDWRGKGI